jgi:peroxiredoxin
MKKMKSLILIVLVLMGCNAQKRFDLQGTLENGQGRTLYLDELEASTLTTIDSLIVSDDGSFQFTHELTVPKFFLLRGSRDNFITLLIQPGEKVTIDANMDNLSESYTIKGSPDSKLIQEYNSYLQQNIDKLRELNQIYNDSLQSPNIQSIITDLDEQSNRILEDQKEYTIGYITANNNSLVSLLALYQQITPRNYVLDPMEDISYFEMVDSVLYALYPESGPVQALHAQIIELNQRIEANREMELLLGMGSVPPEIALPNPEGDTITLYSTKGNIVLLDFWAAWCNPCRVENPNLVKHYNKYHSKGFEIFQVSLDRERDNWLEAIESDGLEQWIHVSDLNYWNSIVVSLYHLQQIPTNFLLDREGKIIARDLRGENLGEKLSEIFD